MPLGVSVRRGALLVFSFDVAAKAVGAVATLLVIRLLPAAEYATYTLVLAIVAVIIQAIASGVNRIYILAHELQAHSARGPLLAVQLFAGGALSMASCLAFGLPMAVGFSVTALAAAFIASDFVKTEYQRQLAFKRFSYVELSRNFLFFALLVLAVSAGQGHWTAEVVTAVQSVALGVVAIPLAMRMKLLPGFLRLDQGMALARRLAAGNHRYLFGYFLVLGLLSQLAVFMLKNLGDEQNLAAFGSAFRYYSLLLIALGAVHTVLLPTIATARTKSELREIYQKHRGLIWLFAASVLVGVLSAPRLIPLVDGGRYPEAIPAFQVLALSSVISFAFSPHVNLVMRFQSYPLLFALVCWATLLSLALNMLFIPSYGALGAAMTVLLSYALINGMTYVCARRLLARCDEVLPAR